MGSTAGLLTLETGSLVQLGPNISHIQIQATIYATIQVSGTLAFDGGLVNNGSLLGAGVLIDGGTSNSINYGSFLSLVSLDIENTSLSVGNITYDAPIDNDGTFTVGGGAVLTAGLASPYSGAAEIGPFTINGTAELHGTIAAPANPGGTVIANYVLHDDGLTVKGGATLMNQGTASQGADITLGGAGVATAVLNNGTGAVYNLTGNGNVNLAASGAGTIVNDGTFAKIGGTGTSTIAASFSNDSTGMIVAAAGTLKFTAALTNAGHIMVNGGTVIVNAGSAALAASISARAVQ
jgi:hypothetical protein